MVEQDHRAIKQRCAPMLTGRAFARSLVLTDGRVLTAGGDTPGAFASDSVELLRIDGLRRSGPSLGTPRVLHSVTPLRPQSQIHFVRSASSMQ